MNSASTDKTSGAGTRRARYRFGIAIAVSALVVGTATSAGATTATHVKPAAASPSVHYAVNEPICAQPKDPNAMRCFALRRVDVPKGTRGAYAYVRPNAIGLGPGGGYTPDDLAAAYDYNPNVNRSSQLVGIVDWFDDPDALSDLNAFDSEYGLRRETSASFRKVNQTGKTSPLPKSDHEGSGEIALDVESVRGVCHTCRILLVEANGPSDADLAAAENRAAAMGATEISNSFGESEHKVSASVLAAYNHPGVVITASTGDDGWYGWDFGNNPTDPKNPNASVSRNAAEFPSTDPDVVAVGGTTLDLNNDGSRSDEYVWNENGADDQNGIEAGQKRGAGGGGCSRLYAAKPWQAHYPGYAAAGCKGKRLAADISAIADPATGFDVLDSYAPTPGWQTIGGTSLAAPVTAALFALAGGSGGAAYPASTLYTNGSVRAPSLFDVTIGGNGFCAGDSTSSCGGFVFNFTGGQTHNPNGLGAGNVECSFPRAATPTTPPADPASPPPFSSECNAVTGYDGPSGLGAPKNDALYTSTNPRASITRPSLMKLHTAEPFTAHASEPLSGTHLTNYYWNWGDGHATSTNSASTTNAVKHNYTKPGAYTVTLTVTDSRYQVGVQRTTVTVGKKARVHLKGPGKLHVGQKGSFSSRASDPNTGAKIRKVTWHWGDRSKTTGAAAKHKYAKTGTYTVTVTFADNTGVTTTVHKKVKVVKA
jgi:hypothetical protein